MQKSWSAFHICGYTGLILALFLSTVLALLQGLSLWMIAGLAVSAIFTFLTLAMITKIITGEEHLAFYYHKIAVISVAALTLLWWRQQVLPYLDVVILSIGLFQACGRIGCLMVGCCYGCPHPWGVCYQHANIGLPAYLVGVRLFPIQALEFLWGGLIVLVGSLLVFNHQAPGEAFVWYILSYGAARFCLEFFRGDPERPYLWGFSEAQWTSVLLITMVVWAGFSRILPFHWWHVGVLGAVILIGFAVTLKRRFQTTDEYSLLHPKHIREVAEALELVSQLAIQNSSLSTIHVARTSLGVQISASRIEDKVDYVDHYTFSSERESLNPAKAWIVARLILQLRRVSSPVELIEGRKGVFHLIGRQAQAIQSMT